MRLATLAMLGCALGLCACGPTPDPRVEPFWTGWIEGGGGPALVEAPPAALPAPEGLRAANGGFRSVRLEWEPLLTGEVGGYAVERSFLSDGPFTRIAAVPGRFSTVYVDGDGSSPEADVTSLGDGASAFYRVRAFSADGRLASAVSDVVVATTAPLPAAPLDLRAYSLQPRTVPLAWGASEDPTLVGYVIERSPSSRGPFETVARLEGRHRTVWEDRGLGDLRVLHYRVAGVNAAGAVGSRSEVVRAVTKPEPLPPYRLRVVEQALGSNRLAWDPNVEPDLAGYRLLRRRAGGDAAEVVVSLPPHVTTAVDAAVGADERLSYSLVAVDREGLESAAAPPLPLTSAGYDLRAKPGPRGVELRWNPRSEEGWQRARVLRTRMFRTREIGIVEGAEFVDADVVPGERYRYSVVLERADAERAPASSPVEVSVPES